MASALGREPLAGQFLQTLPPILLRLKCLCAHPLTTANPLSHFRHRLTRGHSQENGDCADDIHIFANAHSYTIGSSIPFKNRPLSSKYSRKKGRAAAGSGYRREEQAFSLAVRWGDQNRSLIRKSGAQDPNSMGAHIISRLYYVHVISSFEPGIYCKGHRYALLEEPLHCGAAMAPIKTNIQLGTRTYI